MAETEHKMVLFSNIFLKIEKLEDLLKHHKNSEEKSKDLDYFTVGAHPDYPMTRCFFVVTKDGNKRDFSA